MIKTIIDTFRQQARQHKTIKAFYYNRNYEKGSGKDIYPLLWLEDPLMGNNRNHAFQSSVDFCILFVPTAKDSVEELQNLAFSIGLNILERIKSDAQAEVAIEPNWSYITLRDYYDDDACGCRFSVKLTQRNMQNLCLIDEQFDANKVFEVQKTLSEFDVKSHNASEVFSNKLPEFNLKIRK